MIDLATWRAQLAALAAECPWPGPRPLRRADDDRERLAVRRDRDLPELVDDVISHRLVILSGESGVGKSSLVSAGLGSALESAGFEVFELRDWSLPDFKIEGEFLAERFIAKSLNDKYRSHVWNKFRKELDQPTSFADILDYGLKTTDDPRPSPVVLVLDQFEELIRYDEALFADMLRWIRQVNRENRFHLVLSLRSEYAHKLRSIEAKARPFSVAKYVLEPLFETADIAEVLRAGSEKAEKLIEPLAEERILQWWADLLDDSSMPPSSIGLLHVQALLFELYFRQRDRATDGESDVAISLEVVEEYERGVVDEYDREMIDQQRHPGKDRQAITRKTFQRALECAIDRKLRQCEEMYRAAAGTELDRPLLVGTKEAIRRTVPHLSSGGYKHVQDKWDLARLALDRELKALGLAHDVRARDLFKAMSEHVSAPGDEVPPDSAVDLLSGERWALAGGRSSIKGPILTDAELGLAPDQQLERTRGNPYLEQAGLGPAPWTVDPDDRSAGMMQGQAPWSVLVEEFRRFLFAIEWMEHADLIRRTTLPGNRTMLSLIHDGFSDALAAWSSTSQDESGPDAAVHQLTASSGEEFDWKRTGGGLTHWPAFDGGEPAGGDGTSEARVVVNLRWRFCSVRADFRRVVFANCDFRGTRFVDCTFEGVTFVNCLLDSAAFERCQLLGKKRMLSESVGVTSNEDLLPSFEISGAASSVVTPAFEHGQIEALTRYQGSGETGADALLSVTSGVPARPAVPDERGNSAWEPAAAGVAVFGGRLNTITVQNCAFDEGARLYLCLITGSSLDLVEQPAARVEIRNSLIRGLSVTGPVASSDGAAGDSVHVTAQNSVLANVWFGAGLKPKLELDEFCVVWQLTNLSDGAVEAATGDALRHGVVDVRTFIEAHAVGPDDSFDADGLAADIVTQKAQRMDFRSAPAKLEIDPD